VNLKADIEQRSIFERIARVAEHTGVPTYVVGGYVRDIFLNRPSHDIDFVVVGSGIDFAREVANSLGAGCNLAVYATYGTAQVKWQDRKSGITYELEFVGARRESYNRNSRNPIVEDGTLEDDLARRDFTINAMAISLNADTYGEVVDNYCGLADLAKGIIRTPLNPDITYSDDPLRMMRAIRFATQLNFRLHPDTMAAISTNADRIKIITRERIADELMKIIHSTRPSIGFRLLHETGLLAMIMPELEALAGVEMQDGVGHKDNFLHTLQVVDNVAAISDNVWLRWAALMHDIAKPQTKKFVPGQGWTFHNHNFIGEKMVPRIFKRMRLPLDHKMKYVSKLVGMHMRPQSIGEEGVTDSAVRRMMFEAGEDSDDLMMLAECDLTSKNPEKVRRILQKFKDVRARMVEIEEKDRIRCFQPPVNGGEIMRTFNLPPCTEVGAIKDRIKDAILDGEIPNEHSAAYALMLRIGTEMGLQPVE